MKYKETISKIINIQTRGIKEEVKRTKKNINSKKEIGKEQSK